MIVELVRKYAPSGKRYTLPEGVIVTVITYEENTVRICFHWNTHEHPCRSGIDIDGMCIGMFDTKDGTLHIMHGVPEEDAKEFDNWFKSFS